MLVIFGVFLQLLLFLIYSKGFINSEFTMIYIAIGISYYFLPFLIGLLSKSKKYINSFLVILIPLMIMYLYELNIRINDTINNEYSWMHYLNKNEINPIWRSEGIIYAIFGMFLITISLQVLQKIKNYLNTK